jgi:succinate dehydrogenase / fumarate reductase, cytochrome b subunit
MNKTLSFLDTTIGKKIAMALSGLVLFGFVIGHMLGNLQLFLGPEVFNHYATTLHGNFPLLWGTRVVLAVSIAVHISMALQLVSRSEAARPVAYRVKKNQRTTFAALTMKMSGINLLLFVLYHLAHFTFPGVAMGPYEHRPFTEAYSNVIHGFSVPWVVALYIVAMLSLGSHLYHGAHSLFQTLGLNHPSYNARAKMGAQVVALFITTGNIMLPLCVFFGVIR